MILGLSSRDIDRRFSLTVLSTVLNILEEIVDLHDPPQPSSMGIQEVCE